MSRTEFPFAREEFREAAEAGKPPPRKKWWQAQAKPAPVLELTQAQRDEIKQREKAEKLAAAAAANPAAARPAASAARPTPGRGGTSAGTRPTMPPMPQRPPRPRGSGEMPQWAWWLIVLAIWILARQLIR